MVGASGKKQAEVTKIANLSDLISHLKADLEDDMTYWYRGHSKSEWELLPSLARDSAALVREPDLIARFKQNAALLLENLPRSEWEWLTIMQHHGVPTRLLDWTESPLVGLYFSVEDKQHDHDDGALWVLCPKILNETSNIRPDYPRYIPNFEDEPLKNYTPTALTSEKFSRQQPIAVMGMRNTPRMQAQLGVHTVIHRDRIAIEDVGNGNHVWKYEVPSAVKEDIRRELSLISFGKFQLFPELQTLGEMLGEL